MENLVILEDSSKVNFGGGQNITLLICKNFLKKKILFFDFSKDSMFNNEMKALNIHCIEFLWKANWLLLLNIPLLLSKLYCLKTSDTILYATSKKTLLLAYFINLLLGIRFIYHYHLIEKKSRVIFVLKHLLRRAHCVIFVSELSKLGYSNNNFRIIRNPIDIQKKSFVKKINKNHITVASISSLIKIKGIQYFIDSYDYIDDNVMFNIYGSGHESYKNLNDNIIFMGAVPNKDIIDALINKIDILIVPSIIEESFGLVILEAFSAGVPVITTNIGMQKILVLESQAGVLVDIKNSKQIANAINFLIDNDNFYQELSEKGITFANKFNIDNFYQEINQIFK